MVASWYSFQNIASMQKAFSEWLSLDFRSILKEAVTRTIALQPLDQVLSDLITRRHGIIHKLDLDFGIRRDDVAAAMEAVNAVIDAFVDYLEKTRGMVIRDETACLLGDGDS